MIDQDEEVNNADVLHVRRYNNLALRFLQLGIQLFIGKSLSEVGIRNKNCEPGIVSLIFIGSLILILVNIGFLLFIFLKKTYIKNLFYFILAIQVILTGVIMVLGLGEAAKEEVCANLIILNKFSGIQSLIGLFLSIYILCAPFNISQRYPNTPGNITWVFLFMGYTWNDAHSTIFIIIGIINLLISLFTAGINLVSLFVGMSQKIRRIMYYQWLISIGLLVICGIAAFVIYVTNVRKNDYEAIMANKLCEIFIGVNIVDIIFWLWGFFIVKDQFGLTMRESLIVEDYSDKNEQENDLDNRHLEEVQP